MKKSKDGLKRGYYGVDVQDAEFLKPDFDRERQVGERAVGMFATADKPQVVRNGDNA